MHVVQPYTRLLELPDREAGITQPTAPRGERPRGYNSLKLNGKFGFYSRSRWYILSFKAFASPMSRMGDGQETRASATFQPWIS